MNFIMIRLLMYFIIVILVVHFYMILTDVRVHCTSSTDFNTLIRRVHQPDTMLPTWYKESWYKEFDF